MHLLTLRAPTVKRPWFHKLAPCSACRAQTSVLSEHCPPHDHQLIVSHRSDRLEGCLDEPRGLIPE